MHTAFSNHWSRINVKKIFLKFDVLLYTISSQQHKQLASDADYAADAPDTAQHHPAATDVQEQPSRSISLPELQRQH